MSAERVIAWNEMFAALGHDPHTVPADVRRVVHAAALKYARASGYRPPASEGESRQPERDKAATQGDGAVFPNYGNAKGKPVRGADVSTLRFYERGCVRTLDDQEKSRWHDKERALLEAIRAELRRRGEAAEYGD